MERASNETARKRLRQLSLLVQATTRLASILRLKITSSCASSENPEKRALLIGISYLGTCMPLKGPLNDVQIVKAFLIGFAGYDQKNIVILEDRIGTSPNLLPTKQNIMREIDSLAASGAKHQFFLYSGHSSQRPEDKNGECVEDDGQEEYIIPCDSPVTAKGTFACDDDHIITDKVLKQHLVKGLKKHGTQLVAIFDSCHSDGRPLDLRHQKCNEVDGIRNRARGACRQVIDKLIDGARIIIDKDQHDHSAAEDVDDDVTVHGEDSSDPPSSKPAPIRKSYTQMTCSSRVADIVRSKQLRSVCRAILRRGKRQNHCSGFCPVISMGNKSQVICISACKDSQQNYEVGGGRAMAQIIVEYLEKNPTSTYRELMQATRYSVNLSREGPKKKLKHQKPGVGCQWAWIPFLYDWHKCRRDERYENLKRFVESKCDPQLSTRYPFKLDSIVEF